MSVFGNKVKWENPLIECYRCSKQARASPTLDWITIDIRNKDTQRLEECRTFCGWDCMTTHLIKETTVIDPTKPELDALMVAGQAGGQYLESLGRYDLSALSEDEWVTFLSCVISTYQDEKIPF